MRLIPSLIPSLILIAAFAGGIACGSLEDALLGAECLSPDDCGPLKCVAPNPNGLNPAGIGWCLDSNVCIVGEQPYCPCGLDPASSDPACSTPYTSGNMVQATVACWDGSNMATCLCLPPSVTCQYDPP